MSEIIHAWHTYWLIHTYVELYTHTDALIYVNDFNTFANLFIRTYTNTSIYACTHTCALL